MPQYLFEGEPDELNLLVKLARKLNVKVTPEPTRHPRLSSLKAGLEELKAVRQGKKQSRPASELIAELRNGKPS